MTVLRKAGSAEIAAGGAVASLGCVDFVHGVRDRLPTGVWGCVCATVLEGEPRPVPSSLRGTGCRSRRLHGCLDEGPLEPDARVGVGGAEPVTVSRMGPPPTESMVPGTSGIAVAGGGPMVSPVELDSGVPIRPNDEA